MEKSRTNWIGTNYSQSLVNGVKMKTYSRCWNLKMKKKKSNNRNSALSHGYIVIVYLRKSLNIGPQRTVYWPFWRKLQLILHSWNLTRRNFIKDFLKNELQRFKVSFSIKILNCPFISTQVYLFDWFPWYAQILKISFLLDF